MKNLSRIAIILIALVTVGISLQSCKKGSEDPSISLKSRKARLAGDYTLTAMNAEGEEKEKTVSGNCEQTSSEAYTIAYQNGMEIRTSNITTTIKSCFQQKDTTITTVEKDTMYVTTTVNFGKDGSYKKETTELQNPLFPNIKTVYTETGTWNFASGVGEVKNKEQVILNQTKYSVATTNSHGATTTSTTDVKSSYAEIISLKQLRSDEIIMVMENSYVSPNGYNSDRETREITLTEN